MDVKNWFPNASQDFYAINSDGVLPSSEPKSAFFDGTDGTVKGKAKDTGRYTVSITSYRTRECDPDNLIGKYFVDALRYAGIIHDDREEDIIYTITQKKVQKKNQEKTLVIIDL